MSCPEFEQKGYLYLSDELESSERIEFEGHLKRCAECREELEKVRETWHLIERLPLEKPSREVREAVLSQARRKKEKSIIKERLQSLRRSQFFPRGISWGLPLAATAIVLFFLVVHPFKEKNMGGSNGDSVLQWRDDFISEADWMHKEIDRMESGVLLASYASNEEEDSDPMDWLSPMNQDLDWIRGKVEDLMSIIYGI
ncbi:MAG: zf-HC2 domain-containing protein [bacterium]